ncbi:enolase 1, putative [Cryptococcus gattii WM276]|uniref:phosphopyruvate hydratase n=1 Tax=Cryptococcus gattii serotype B (strain WM276 / ATCC MYA-4071) TaxID=367775 RepID=E6R573_CRYGW|nr:enolase 1, putative [Cryptococcus gattii WM276]ADV22187.1 enolase 1, putative [Cryptococcus gattii WM276]
MSFQSVKASQIFDSRGNPTVEVVVLTPHGRFVAGVPSGASTGSHEAVELRDKGDPYGGKGVSTAIKAVNETLGPALVQSNIKASEQAKIDQLLIQLDGTDNKSKYGSNAILGISMAAARAGAAEKGLELFEHLADLAFPQRDKGRPYVLPVPCTNQLNGGVHAGNQLAPQEFMILPTGATSFEEAMQIATECYHSLKSVITKKFGLAGTGIGDEGGFAPPVDSIDQAMDLLVEACAKAGHSNNVHFAIDPASSEFFKDGVYDLDFKSTDQVENHRRLSPDQMISLYNDLISKYPFKLLEDPFAEDDWDSWTKFMEKINGKVEVVGDDLLCTQVSRVKMAKKASACDGLLLKINQCGTISEAIEAAQVAYSYGWSVFVSHRSGETIDDFIADIVVGLQTGHIKSGAPCRGERLAKYNRLLQIERLLKERGHPVRYAGADFRRAATW